MSTQPQTQETNQVQSEFPGPMEFLQYFAEPTLIMGLHTNEEGKFLTRLYLALPSGEAIGGPLMTHKAYDTKEEAELEAIAINDGNVITYPHVALPKIVALGEPSIDFAKGEWKLDIRTIIEFGDFLDNHITLTVGDYTLSFPDEYSAKSQFKIVTDENVKFDKVVNSAKEDFAKLIEEIKANTSHVTVEE